MVFQNKARRALRAAARGFIDLFFPLPPPCPLCGAPVSITDEMPLCTRCWHRLPPIGRRRCRRCGRGGYFSVGLCPLCVRRSSALDVSRSYGVYDGFLRTCIHALKYRSDMGAGVALGTLMAWIIGNDGAYGPIDAVVPVPLDMRREDERGYNQARVLAAVVSRYMGVGLESSVARVRETSPQSRLPWYERSANVRGAFAVVHPDRVHNRRILLVDDIWTTGATLEEMAVTLKRAGARTCHSICAAAASLDNHFQQRPAGEAGETL